MPPRLSASFYQRDPVTVAKQLLGQQLVRVLNGKRLAGIIVETEAYLGLPDHAAHTYNGRRTPRNASMWRSGGHAYVYFTYGLHFCMNVVSGLENDPVAVLLRALQPTENLHLIQLHRPKAKKHTDLCSGPAKLCQALAIDRNLDGLDLTTSNTLFIEHTCSRPYSKKQIITTPRIGVDYAGPWARKPLRFFLRDNTHVSQSRSNEPRP